MSFTFNYLCIPTVLTFSFTSPFNFSPHLTLPSPLLALSLLLFSLLEWDLWFKRDDGRECERLLATGIDRDRGHGRFIFYSHGVSCPADNLSSIGRFLKCFPLYSHRLDQKLISETLLYHFLPLQPHNKISNLDQEHPTTNESLFFFLTLDISEL